MKNNTVLNHLISILLLPITVTVVIPIVVTNYFSNVNLYEAGNTTLPLLGIALISLGTALVLYTIFLFAFKGKGTLAPWNPTNFLVTEGPYAYVRNPMIIGVIIILVGQSLFLNSVYVAFWMFAFAFINNIYFHQFEEAELERKFGNDYSDYSFEVKRWFPRMTAYKKAKNAFKNSNGIHAN